MRLEVRRIILVPPKKKRGKIARALIQVSINEPLVWGWMEDERSSSSYERVLTTNRLTLTFGVRGDSFVCEPSDSKRALRLLADSMLSCSPAVLWAISISAICWLLDAVVFPSVSSQCSNFAHSVFARAAFCACLRNSSSTWNTRFPSFLRSTAYEKLRCFCSFLIFLIRQNFVSKFIWYIYKFESYIVNLP